MSGSQQRTIFPSLLPSQLDSAWFPNTDRLTDEASISQAEDAYEAWKNSIRNDGDGSLPYGKTIDDHIDRDETYNSGSDNTSEEDLDTDVLDDQDSLQDTEIDITSNNNDANMV